MATPTEDTIRALLNSGHTPGDAATRLGLEVCETYSAVMLPGVQAVDDGGVVVEYADTPDSEEVAKLHAEAGGWLEANAELGDRTAAFVEVATFRRGFLVEEDGEVVEVACQLESHTVVLQPAEPPCAEGDEHEWQSPHAVVGGCEQNPGVFGNGGGVVIREVCPHCGVYRVTDTWARNPVNGQQGHTTIEYRDADENDE